MGGSVLCDPSIFMPVRVILKRIIPAYIPAKCNIKCRVTKTTRITRRVLNVLKYNIGIAGMRGLIMRSSPFLKIKFEIPAVYIIYCILL